MIFSINDIITETNYFKNEVKKIPIKLIPKNLIFKDYININEIIGKLKNNHLLSKDLEQKLIKDLFVFLPLLHLLELPLKDIDNFYFYYELKYDFIIKKTPSHFSEEFVLDVIDILTKLEERYKDNFNKTIILLTIIDFYMSHFIDYNKFDKFNKSLYERILSNYDNLYKIMGINNLNKIIHQLEIY
jgi:hypothetical protein